MENHRLLRHEDSSVGQENASLVGVRLTASSSSSTTTVMVVVPRTAAAALLTALLSLSLLHPAAAGGAALAARSGISPYKVPSGPQAYCKPCDIRTCPQILPEACDGTLIKDDCGCCPRCDHRQRPASLETAEQTNHTCADVTCKGSEMCVLNIQGIPICRCPSVYWCRRQDRREVCGRDGKTYRSKCYLKVEECTQNKKIRVAHKGACEQEGGAPAKRGPKVNRRDPQARRQRRRRNRKRTKGERGNKRRPKRDQGARGGGRRKKPRLYHFV